MAVKMRVSKIKMNCTSCNGRKGKGKVKELYDLAFGNEIVHLCQLCMADLLRLTCKANHEYNARVKQRHEL